MTDAVLALAHDAARAWAGLQLSPALLLQICASSFALLGAWLLRKPGPRAAWGFVTWLVSNPAAMAFMALQGHWLFFLQHLVFFLLAAESVWHWLWLPSLQQNRGKQ